MWLDKEKTMFLLRNLPFQAAVSSNLEAYKESVFGIIESSFHHVDVFKNNADGLSEITVIPFAESNSFSFEDSGFDVSEGDCLITMDCLGDLGIGHIQALEPITFYYSKQKMAIGSGSKNFKVTCTVKDVYSLDVFAETEEEAILIAKGVAPSKWEHLVIDNHLEETHMIRMGRWGNFEARMQ